MSDPDAPDGRSRQFFETLDDLPWRVRMVAIAGCLLVVASAIFLPQLLLDTDWTLRNAWFVGPAVGALSALSALKVSNWWLSGRRPRPAKGAATGNTIDGRPDATIAEVLERTRRSVRWYTVRRWLAWLVLPLVALISVSGHASTEHDAQLLRTQPVRTATVVDVEIDYLARGNPRTVTVELDGRPVQLFLEPDGYVAVGDMIDVVVDPQDPSYALPTTAHDGWEYTPWGHIAITGVIGALLLYAAWAGVPSRQAVRSLRNTPDVTAATVVKADPDQATVHTGSDDWVWYGDAHVRQGSRIHIVGTVEPGAWVLLDNGRTIYWPDKPLNQHTLDGP
jgi:hypothetical protein